MPPFLLPLIGGLTTFTTSVVEIAQSKAKPTVVAKRVLKATEALVDSSFDQFPEWKKLSEERRDKIVGGLTELGLFITELVKR